MKLIVGLGNIGKSYQFTRHNIGFMVLDALSEEDWQDKQSRFLSFVRKIAIKEQAVLLAKPKTLMNLSGQAVQKLLNYYSIDKKDLLVIHDDMDLEFLTMKFQISRGAGGHNGVQNIHDLLGHKEYYRLKMGVGRPKKQKILTAGQIEKSESSDRKEASRHVLSSFDKGEHSDLEDFIVRACKAVQHFVLYGGISAGNTFNQK